MKTRNLGRLTTAVLVGLLLLTPPLAAEAQEKGKVYRIGFLSLAPLKAIAAPPLFAKRLRELGYVQGQNLSIEWHSAEGKIGRLPVLAADLVRLNVDIIVAVLNPEIAAARHATASVPIVMLAGVDPVGAGFVQSLAHPGGNITGVAYQTPEVTGKTLAVLKETVPSIASVAVMFNPDFPGMAPHVAETSKAAEALGITLHGVEVREPDDFPTAFAKIRDGHVNALYVVPTPLVLTHRPAILEFAAKNRLPAIYLTRTWVEQGGLMSYSAHFSDLVRRSASYVDRILRGAKPADLPVEQPTRFELVINAETAKALNLTIPRSVLVRADEIIQ